MLRTLLPEIPCQELQYEPHIRTQVSHTEDSGTHGPMHPSVCSTGRMPTTATGTYINRSLLHDPRLWSNDSLSDDPRLKDTWLLLYHDRVSHGDRGLLHRDGPGHSGRAGRLLHHHGVSHGDRWLLYRDSLPGYNRTARCLLHHNGCNRRGGSWRRLLYHHGVTGCRGHHEWNSLRRLLYHDSVTGGGRAGGVGGGGGGGDVGLGRILRHHC